MYTSISMPTKHTKQSREIGTGFAKEAEIEWILKVEFVGCRGSGARSC